MLFTGQQVHDAWEALRTGIPFTQYWKDNFQHLGCYTRCHNEFIRSLIAMDYPYKQAVEGTKGPIKCIDVSPVITELRDEAYTITVWDVPKAVLMSIETYEELSYYKDKYKELEKEGKI